MPLNKEENALASREVLAATRAIGDARKQLSDAEKSFADRRVGEGKSKLRDVGGYLRQVSASVEDLSRALGLKDPKEVLREDLSERYSKVSEAKAKALLKQREMEEDKDTDPHFLTAVSEVIGRYDRDLANIRNEAGSNGIQIGELVQPAT
jgi:hypothetical protein